MRHHKIMIAAIAIAAAAGVSGIAAAATSSPSGTAAVRSTATAVTATVHGQNATVGDRTETVLVDAKGLPLYYYKLDTPTKSFVSGALASFWPPLISSSPTISGAPGKITVTHDSNGAQVAYNGHFLYTFANDSTGHVTGQGVEDFFVATPGLAASGTSPASSTPAPTSGSGTGWGY